MLVVQRWNKSEWVFQSARGRRLMVGVSLDQFLIGAYRWNRGFAMMLGPFEIAFEWPERSAAASS